MSTFEEALEKLKAREQQAREQARAEGRRPLSTVKRRLIESSIKISATTPDEILFQHTVFCQTVLPYRDPGPEVRTWERQQGNVKLFIEAGKAYDPATERLEQIGLPYGPAARLILCHLNTEALRTSCPIIGVQGSMTAFVARLHGFSPDGYQIRRFKDQLNRLSTALIRLVVVQECHAVQIDTKIISAFDL
jgi:hypothetical protein